MAQDQHSIHTPPSPSPSPSQSPLPSGSNTTSNDSASNDTSPSSQRLSMPNTSRIILGAFASGSMGFTLGAMQGGQTAQLRFRAEHAHKMPDTTAGWYFYHKSKNYHAMQGGIREGLRMACKTSAWSFVALGLESTVDRMRGHSDVLSTVVATVSVAGMFSLANKLSLPAAARTAKYGLLFGLVYGGVQDAVGLARGRPVSYVEAVRRRFGSLRSNQSQAS